MACLAWDAASALRWATLLAELRAAGRQMPIKDSLIAATALVHDLTVVTRDVRDFRAAGIRVLDPFEPAEGGCPSFKEVLAGMPDRGTDQDVTSARDRSQRPED